MPIKQSLQRLTKYLAYFAAAVVIFLAVTIGLFRLMLPQLPGYQKEIKDWISTAIGVQIEFTDMNARWRLSGPELNFYNAERRHQSLGRRTPDSLYYDAVRLAA